MQTMLDVACPSCGETFHVAETHVGRSLRCRRCGRVFEVTAPPPAGAAAAAAPSPGDREAAPRRPITVTEQDFAQSVLRSPRPVVVDFWATWCPPCLAMEPAVEQLAGEYAGRVTFAKLNADENPGLMMQYGVMGLPTLLLFKDGREAGRLVGLQPKAAIKRAVDRVA